MGVVFEVSCKKNNGCVPLCVKKKQKTKTQLATDVVILLKFYTVLHWTWFGLLIYD